MWIARHRCARAHPLDSFGPLAGTRIRIPQLLAATMLVLFTASAEAKDPGEDAYMVRVLACAGPDAKMEVYLPQTIVFGREGKPLTLEHPVIGYYTLDLTEVNKGKVLEPVRVRLSADRRNIVLDQYTRGLPPTRIPLSGGTVDFDKRFGTAAKCDAFQAHG
jgi:hypothetical protein